MKGIGLVIVALILTTNLWSQNGIPLLGEPAPSFTANTTNGEINFPSDFGSNWKILFSHPRDFTPVCSSEILQLAKMKDEFEALGVKIAVVSTDEVSHHTMWKNSLEEINRDGTGTVKIDFPLIDDKDAKVSKLYGMIHKAASTTKDVRGVFIIDPENKIQSINFYPMNVGRNMDEVKRIVMALQTSLASNVLTPANWEPGDDVLMHYSPYPNEELEKNPEKQKQYYNVGNYMWYKKNADN